MSRTRRSTLSAVGAAISTALFTGVSVADAGSSATEFKNDGHDGARVPLGKALRNDDVREIHKEFVKKGWTPDEAVTSDVDNKALSEIDDPQVVQSNVSSVVTVLYDTGNDDIDGAITWYDTGEVLGLESLHYDASGDGENDHYEFTHYYFEDGKLASEIEIRENFLGCSSVT